MFQPRTPTRSNSESPSDRAMSNESAAKPYRVLLVEDDVELARLTADYLALRGIEVLVEHHGDRAIARLNAERPDMLVLDVMLPGKDGFDICRDLRQAGNDIPILMLTARDEDIDQVLGLELGADDYLTKPVQPRVLLAHVNAILRRLAPSERATEPADQLSFGQLHIRKSARDVKIGDRAIELTTAEFDLLWLLASNAGRVLPRNEILKDLRGLDYDGIDRSIDSRVSRLRRKLGDEATSFAHIKTVRPHGYLFSPVHW